MQKNLTIWLLCICSCTFVACSRASKNMAEMDSPIPSNYIEDTSILKNAGLKDSIVTYLLTQNNFSWQTKVGSKNFCVIENLDPEKELFPLYLWIRCGEFIREDDSIHELSGISVPAVINYPNHLSYYNPDKFTHTIPRGGSLYSEDIKKLFPSNLYIKILNFDISKLNKAILNIASNKI